jgi:Ty3 transposon capsid-like protein
MSGSSSSSTPPQGQFDPAAALQHIAKLEQQLAAANAEGNRVVAALNAEKVKSQQQASSAASRTGLKVPVPPGFKGEVGFGIDNWLRRLVKHFEFFGDQAFPDDDSRIRFAVMFLEGGAMDWWDNIPEVDKDKLITWDLFVETLYSRFRPMQASTVARLRLASLKQTGGVSAYVNLFQKELTPIRDMSPADQIFFFRQGLKPIIAQRVLEKLPKTLYDAMDIAILADAHTNKANLPQSYSSKFSNNHSNAPRAASSSGSTDMDISNINIENDNNVKPPVFHYDEEDSTSISSASSSSDIMKEFNRMKSELKKYQVQDAISALNNNSGSNSSSSRINVSKEEFDHCWKNRLCLKCKKPNHKAVNCHGKYQPLK